MEEKTKQRLTIILGGHDAIALTEKKKNPSCGRHESFPFFFLARSAQGNRFAEIPSNRC